MADIHFECPQCGKHLEIDSRGSGMQIECPDCEVTIVVPQPKTPLRKARSPKSSIQRRPKSGVHKIKKPRKRVVVHGIHDTQDPQPHFNYQPSAPDGAKGLLPIGWTCFTLGLILCLFFPSPTMMFVWIPILLVAMVLAIVAIGYKKTEMGITLALMTLFLPLGGYFLAQKIDLRGAAGILVSSGNRFDKLAIERVESKRVDDKMVLTGRVRNNGKNPMFDIKVKVDFTGDGGVLIVTRTLEVISKTQGLPPGLSRSFKVETDWNERITNFDYHFVE